MTSKPLTENLVVFAHLNPEGFVPAGLLHMTEATTRFLGAALWNASSNNKSDSNWTATRDVD